MKTKRSKHYIDNEKFIEELTKFKQQYNENKANGIDERPQISNYLGECFMKISEGFSNRGQFNRYPYKDELVADGVFFCIKYLHNFDPAKVKKPTDAFNYFTMFVYHAFLQRIQREKKNLYVKLKSIQRSEMSGDMYDSQDGENFDIDANYSEQARMNLESFVEKFEEKNFPKKKSKK